jgi:2-methylcitrate dehydratase PrpD
MTTTAAALGQFVAEQATADLPPQTLTHARMVVASTVASAAVGARLASTAVIRTLAAERGGIPEARVWFAPASAPRLPAELAARVNAVASDAAASDDSDLRNIAHIGTIVASTALALGERMGSSGTEVLAALVLGYDVAGRIGAAITPGYSERGFHGSVITVFGGATVAARILRLSPPQVAHALALAATSIGGLYAAANTSVAREYHAGLSAMLGVEAALAAANEFAVDETLLDTPRGFFDTFGAHDVEPVTRGLGTSWEILDHLAIKLVPGAHPYHAAAEATASAARDLDVAPEQIESIIVAARPMGRTLVYHPTDLVSMAHSLPYFVAAAAVDRAFGWEHAATPKILDPVIASVQDRVHLDPEAEHSAAVAPTCGARVKLSTTSGQSVVRSVKAPRGSSDRGIGWADVDAKYRTLLTLVDVDRSVIDSSLDLIHRLDSLDQVSSLTAALAV